MNEKKNFMDKLVELIEEKLVPLLTEFASFRPMQVIRNGMVALVPMILLSSIFLILYMLGSPMDSGDALLPFVTPFLDKLLVVHQYGLSFMALYASIAFGIAFSDVYDTDKMATAILSLNCFLAININNFNVDVSTLVANFAGQGLFGCMISSFIAGFFMYECNKRKITINLPSSVPPEILNSFKAIVPFILAVPVCWIIRTVFNFDVAVFLNTALGPIFSYADSPLGYGLYCFILLVLWSVGMHGDNILDSIASPLTLLWGAENAAAATAGTALTALPHVWAYSFRFFHLWVAGIWPLAVYLLFSKCKAHKAFGRTIAIPTFFICEPMMFGAPIVLQPILFIPMILSGTISGIVGYLIMNAGFINRIFVNVPWTVPHPLFELMSVGGDFKALIIPVVSFIIGMIIWYPFFKAYEKQGLEQEKLVENVE